MVLAGGTVAFGSYLAARKAAAHFYRGSAVVLDPLQISLASGWWLPGRRGVWKAWACEKSNICCDFVGSIRISALGTVVGTWPQDLGEQIAHAIERNRVVSYVIDSPGGEVTKALPPRHEGDRGRAVWPSLIPELDQAVFVEDKGALAVLTLLDERYPSSKVEPKDMDRVLAIDIWLREQLPGHRIARADYVLLSEGLDRVSGRYPMTGSDSAQLYRWLEKQPSDQWATVSLAAHRP